MQNHNVCKSQKCPQINKCTLSWKSFVEKMKLKLSAMSCNFKINSEWL